MAASRSSRVTRSSVGLNGLDENFCGRTLRNRSIAQPEDTSVSPLPRQESKHDAKHDTKQDTQQDGQQESSLQGKVTDSNASLVEVEHCTSSRKRGLSCLEKDISPEKSENCDRGKGARDASPQIKRTKRCSRSGESQGHDEDPEPLKPESPVSVPEPSKDNSCEEFSSQNSANIAPASPVLSKEEGERTGEKAEDGHVECEGASRSPNAHKAANGLRDNKAEEPSTISEGSDANPTSATSCPSLLNGSQMGAPSSPDSAVPCRNSVPGQMEVSDKGESPEQVTESESDANGRPLTPVQEIAVATSSTILNTNSRCNPSISSTPPSFTELYEHRYTLRTSPRRAANGGKSSSKPTSPRDNGPLREEGEVVVGLEQDCPMVEEPAPSDSVGPSSEEPISGDPGDTGGGQVTGPVDGKGTESSKELTQSQTAEEEEEDEPDVYYFESDHLALKHNKDYQRLLQTIGVLEAQRTQAILDLETLARHQREALADPIGFVEHLQKRVNLGLPCPQRVVQLPDIAWEQYTSGLGDFEREFCDKKRKTRQLKLIFDKGLPLRPKSPVEPKKEGESSTMYSSLPTSDAPENGRQTQMIRGRICHPNKPDTFNQLWTVEEQKKLEQLLVKFPPEEVESRRWQKIADELGNRTAKQVASRVQKYFIKLTKAGIPVPGRTPNLCMYTKKASSKRQHHLNKHLYRPSTFLTSYEPPVYMDEDDERSAYYSSIQDPSADDSDEESVPVELRNLPEYKELLELKRLKKQKLQEIQDDKAGVRHVGYKCDVCGMEPIQGVRWHCQDCPPDNSVDFCSSCSDCLFKTETHKPDHHLEPVYQPETFLDRDYCLPQSTGYNYLDPNYFPANR
uniref:ZZ-type zinc finger-containing protein 3 n=1 Tax=Anabas testudineus TaxID=64144 RepID=A0A7N6AF17_ANATE